MASIISNHYHSVQSPYAQHLMRQRFRSCFMSLQTYPASATGTTGEPGVNVRPRARTITHVDA
jgi:hypothetical protein